MRDTYWRTYEEVAIYLLDRFAEDVGLSCVEGNQSLTATHSETKWLIDVKGICNEGEALVIIECLRHTSSKQDQEQICGLAYRIIEIVSEERILVSPLGFQSAMEKVVQSEGIFHVTLSEKSIPTEYSIRFLNQIFVGIFDHCNIPDKV